VANLTGGWLAARSGVDPVRIELLRRGGELHAVREPGSGEWVYPSRQFEANGKTTPAVARLLRAANEQRLDALRLALRATRA